MSDPTPSSEAPLPELVARIRGAVDEPSEMQICVRVKAALTSMFTRPSENGAGSAGPRRPFLPEWALEPSREGYARHLLHRDPAGRFSVIVMVWDEGQGTPIHDHGGLWCVECVYRGRIRVRSFERGRTDDDGGVCFEEVESVVAGCGEAGHLIPPFDYHVIENPFSEGLAATVHVYGGDMNACNVFEPLGDGRYRAREKSLGFA